MSNASSDQYSTLLFDNTKVADIKINISDEDWQDMLSNPLKEEYHRADITINGEAFYKIVHSTIITGLFLRLLSVPSYKKLPLLIQKDIALKLNLINT